MTISKISTLVSASWLKQRILPTAQKLSSELRVLDSAWVPSPDADNYLFYKEGHIPTALHFDLKEISPAKEGTFHKYSIPEAKVFKQYVEDLGISSNTHIVVYDGMQFKPSFRTWFLFRLFGHDKISVLDGGIYQWQQQGYPLTTEEPEVETGDFEPNFRRHLLRDFDAMTENSKTRREQVMDSRGAPNFYGVEGHPGTGHIPGSVNIPYNTLANEDGTFKSEGQLKEIFEKANIDLNKPLVATCQTAMTACALTAAAFMLGKEDVPVYNGSFTEWGVRAAPNDIIQLKNES